MARVMAVIITLAITIGGTHLYAGEQSLPYEDIPNEPTVAIAEAREIETAIESDVIELPITIVRTESDEVAVVVAEGTTIEEKEASEVTLTISSEEQVMHETVENSEEGVVEKTSDEENFSEETSADEILIEDVQDSLNTLTTNNYGGEFNKEEGIFTHEDGTLYRVKETRVMFSTAYNIQNCGKTSEDPAYGLTASGYQTKEMVEAGINPRVIAVDPTVIPLGTKVYIEVPETSKDEYVGSDFGFASAEDTGGLIKGDRIDVLLLNYQEAIEWGVRYVNLYILEPI